jgi:hypothetical protein
MRTFCLPMLASGIAVLLTADAAAGAAQDMLEARGPQSDSQSPAHEQAEQPVPAGCIRISNQVVCPTEEPAAAAALLAQGPQPSSNASGDRFYVQGLMRDRWPVAVDFMPEPNTRTVLHVTLFRRGFFASGPSIDLDLDRDGLSGRRLVVLRQVELPRDPEVSNEGRPVRVATFEVRSRRLRPDGRVSGHRAPVQVFGIGVGPRAVGSLTLTDVMLANGAASLPMPPPGPLTIEYGYRLRNSFLLVRADLWRHCRSFGCPKLAAFSQLGNRSGIVHGYAQISRLGTYRLSVRAWMNCDAADFRQCADQPAWTAGGAGPLLVQP